MERFAHQKETRAKLFCVGVQGTQKIGGQTIRYIKAQSVDIKRIDPVFDGFEKIVDDVGIVQVELDQIVVAFPVLIGQMVAVIVVCVKIDHEPVFVRRGFPVFQHVEKGCEFTSHMIEHAIENDADAGLMTMADKAREVVIVAKSCIDLTVVGRIVSVGDRFEDWIEQDTVDPELVQGRDPRKKPFQPMSRLMIIFKGRTAGAQGINLIKNTGFKPHFSSSFPFRAGSSSTAVRSVPKTAD